MAGGGGASQGFAPDFKGEDGMDAALAWLLLGLALVVIELLSGTFYLLILGLAAGIGSLVAWYGAPVPVQALCAAIAGIAG